MNDVVPSVNATSFLTLHYRLATEDGVDLVSTFGSRPSTLQMGSGELAPPLEQCLIGLHDGDEKSFVLAPEQAFGQHNSQLVQRIGRSDLPPGTSPELHGVVELFSPQGQKIAGRVREMDDEAVLLDFNHPLAGRTVRFDVALIGIL
jgi:FKBP-type peptidyl-prolyl cis-trans isomerase SlpA